MRTKTLGRARQLRTEKHGIRVDSFGTGEVVPRELGKRSLLSVNGVRNNKLRRESVRWPFD